MWAGAGGNDNMGGGFVTSPAKGNQFDSPAGQGDKSRGGRRAHNVVPVTIKQLLECQGDTLRVVDVDVQAVTILGLVKAVEVSTTKMSAHIDDQTGVIECMQYVGTGSDGTGASDVPTMMPVEGTYGRVVGQLRSIKDSKYINIFKFFPVSDMNELTCHLLEVIQVPMKLKKLKELEAQKTGIGLHGGMSNTLSNSMMASNLGGGAADTSMGGHIAQGGNKAGFKPNHAMILSIIQSQNSEDGLHKDDIIKSVKNKISHKDILQILEDLSGEGHIYSTVDDDHYRATD